MEMHQVRYSLAVCENLSFTQAARKDARFADCLMTHDLAVACSLSATGENRHQRCLPLLVLVWDFRTSMNARTLRGT
jgi:hypothetical protein